MPPPSLDAAAAWSLWHAAAPFTRAHTPCAHEPRRTTMPVTAIAAAASVTVIQLPIIGMDIAKSVFQRQDRCARRAGDIPRRPAAAYPSRAREDHLAAGVIPRPLPRRRKAHPRPGAAPPRTQKLTLSKVQSRCTFHPETSRQVPPNPPFIASSHPDLSHPVTGGIHVRVRGEGGTPAQLEFSRLC